MNKNTMNLLSAAAFAVLALSGCNTTEGLGEDISKAGTAISHAATDTSEKLSTDHKAAAHHHPHHAVTTHKAKTGHKAKKTSATKKTVAVVKADGDTTTTTTTATEAQTTSAN